MALIKTLIARALALPWYGAPPLFSIESAREREARRRRLACR